MPTISLTLPVSATVITAGLHSTNYTTIQNAINGGLDTANWASGKIFAPSKLMQEGATNGQTLAWNTSGATTWVPVGGMVRLFDSTLGADTANFDITSIPGDYISLRLYLYARTDEAAAISTLLVRFNNDSAANYDHQSMFGSGTAATAAETFGATSVRIGSLPGNTAGANLFGTAVADMDFYAGAVNNKVISSQVAHKQGTATGNLAAQIFAGFWRSNSAITRITLLPGGGTNFKAGSRCTLYGMS